MNLLTTGVAPTPSPTLERRVHRMEHDKPGRPLKVSREAVALAGQADAAPPTEQQEDEMPRGVYDRSKSKPRARKSGDQSFEGAGGQAAAAPEKVERRSRAKRGIGKRGKAPAGKPRRAEPSLARFGVFSDGSVQVDAAECKGVLSGDDVDLLVAFVGRLRKKP